MRTILLVSTYDLGRQPFGLASPAAWLGEAGFTVRCLDLALEALDPEAVRAADLVAFHLPMHAATRLAAREIPRVRALHARAHVCAYGLYAPMNAAHLRGLGVHTVLGAEYEADLVRLARHLAGEDVPAPPAAPGPPTERLEFRVPERGALPALERYARLERGDGRARVVGYTEASRGCRHLCRHCPVVPVYQGRFRVVQREIVLEDIRRQVAAGAEHVTFGDPDFFNGPGHVLPLVRALRAEHPRLTYDVTIKIEHLLRHRQHLPTLRETGCLFVTSAVESVDDRVLALLDKGHTRADFVEAVALLREVGLHFHPTFVAFHPWTTRAGYLELLDNLDELDLVESVAPVQLAIRLLVPAGSRLLDLAEVRDLVEPFDAARLVHPWRHADPGVDRLQREVETTVAAASARGEPRGAVFARARALAEAAAGRHARALAWTARAPRRPPVPFLTEPWYC